MLRYSHKQKERKKNEVKQNDRKHSSSTPHQLPG